MISTLASSAAVLALTLVWCIAGLSANLRRTGGWKRSIIDYGVRQMNTCVFVSFVYASQETKVFYHML
jgi:hypothetical protein